MSLYHSPVLWLGIRLGGGWKRGDEQDTTRNDEIYW